MRLAALLLVSLLLLWQQRAWCTSSSGHVSPLSWEAARAAAKADRERNSQLAGFRRGSSLAQPPSSPEDPDSQGLPIPKAGSTPANAPEGSSVQLSRRGAQNRALVVNAEVSEAVAAAVPAPTIAQHIEHKVPAQHAGPPAATPDTINLGTVAAIDGQTNLPGLWEYRWLLFSAACFLLGWITRSWKPAAAKTQTSNEGDNQPLATVAVSFSAASVTEAPRRAQQQDSQQKVSCVPPGDSSSSSIRRVSLVRQPAESHSAESNSKRQGNAAEAPAGEAVQQLSTDSSAQAATGQQMSQQGCSSFTEAPAGPGKDASVSFAAGEEDVFSTTCKAAAVPAAQAGPRRDDSRGRHKSSVRRRGVALSRRSSRSVRDLGGTNSRQQYLMGKKQTSQEQQRPGPGLEFDVQNSQLVQQGQLVQQHQQPVQVVITAPYDLVHTLVVPAVRVLQQLATGVHQLSVLSATVVHQLQQLSSGISSLTSRMDQLLSWATEQDQHKRLAAQQVLGHNAGQMGLALLLVAVGVAALRVGRVWEVHQVCRGRSRGHAAGWRERLTGTRPVTSAWLYTSCCAQELGLYAAGLMVLYWLAKAMWLNVLFNSSRSRETHVNKNWQVDVVVFKAVICAAAGAHIVHCLGAAWLPWVLLWWLWCGIQLLLQTRLLTTLTGLPLVLIVSLVLPVIMALAPFHPGAIQLQGWLMEVVPVLGRLPNIRHLLPFSRLIP
eukprot:GHUV01007021.1.p1 GENE.GHUV01007021.1~~GHUV01007021.1.p1  ORF type:complete len:717 (+),score=210.53 GHUV01007021.1:1028-3178(+)